LNDDDSTIPWSQVLNDDDATATGAATRRRQL
jgi:hypothetical protein